MNAAQLVDLRKNGKITQEQFFLALNKLRRANSGLNKAPSSAPTAATAPAGPTGADGDLKPGTPEGSVGSVCVDAEAAARSDSENSVLKAPDSEGRPPAGATSSRPSQLPPVEQHPAPPVSQLDGNAHGGLEDATAQPPEGSIGEARSINESDLLVRISPGGSEPDRCSVPSEPKTFEVDHFVGERGEREGGVGAAAFGDDQANITLRSRGAVVEEDGGRGGESEWRFTPSGEKAHSVRRHIREAPDPLRHDSPTNNIVFGDGGGDSSNIGRIRSTAGLSPRKTGGGGGSESGDGAVGLGSDNRRPRPPGREPKAHRQRDRRRSRSQPPTPSFPRGAGGAGRVGGPTTRLESGSGEQHDRTERIRYREPSDSGGSQQLLSQSAAQNQRSPTTSGLDRGEQRGFGGAASPGCSKQLLRRSTQTSGITPEASDPARVSDKPLSARRHDPPTRDRNNNITSQPSGALRRSRSLSQEGNAPARGPRRLCINSGSSARNSQEHPDCYNTTVKYDQYGYPLHENQCLESGEAGAGTSGLVFTPTIKRLPEFYESRPKLAPASAKQYLGSMKGEGFRQSSSMYERGTGWKANVDEIRARRLAEREEEEMDACTFQPSLPRRPANASMVARTVGSFSSETLLDGGGSGGIEGGARRGAAGGHDTSPRRAGLVNGAASSSCRSGEGVGWRLFEESKRLSERRFEGEERKRMTQEEAFARTCTFAPSLKQGTAARTISARSRYMEAPRVVDPTAGRAAEESLTFHPKILGVQAGMTRAIEYLSLDVTERLHRPCPVGQHPPVANRSPQQQIRRCVEGERGGGRLQGGFASSAADDWGGDDPHGEHAESPSDRPLERGGDPPASHHQGRRCSEGDSGGGVVGEQQSGTRDQSASAAGWDEAPRRTQGSAPRPQSAPAVSAGGDRRGWTRRPPQEERRRTSRGSATVGRDCRAEAAARQIPHRGVVDGRHRRGEAGRAGGGRQGTRGSGGGQPGSSRRFGGTSAISFQEFLARQAHSQVAASQRLSRLTALHAPSFSPQLSRGSRRITARSGAAGAGACFEDRLNMTARRRERDRKAAALAARGLEEQMCTFSPELTPRAREARSRSARELSIGDPVARAAKQRMAKAREEIRLLDDFDGKDGDFEPRLATAGDDGLAPAAPSRLRLADELDTYIDRVQEAALNREEDLYHRRRRQLADEARSCTFAPAIRDCPDLVKRTAAGMRCIREFRRQEELASGDVKSDPKPGWR